MNQAVLAIHHVNVTVPAQQEESTKRFYGEVLGLERIEKPAGSRTTVGAWYQLGPVQLHLSVEEGAENHASDRHVCYLVSNLEAMEQRFRAAGVDILPDPRPIPGRPRFYVRDPGGNLLEIAQK